MNFIDKALADRENRSDDDFLQAMAGIYHEPEVRKILHKYPPFIRDVIYIIDYDTELQMDGLEGILEGGMSEMCGEIQSALINCGALDEACILHEARQLDIESDDYEEKIAGLQSRTALHNDYEAFWNLVREYIHSNLCAIH